MRIHVISNLFRGGLLVLIALMTIWTAPGGSKLLESASSRLGFQFKDAMAIIGLPGGWDLFCPGNDHGKEFWFNRTLRVEGEFADHHKEDLIALPMKSPTWLGRALGFRRESFLRGAAFPAGSPLMVALLERSIHERRKTYGDTPIRVRFYDSWEWVGPPGKEASHFGPYLVYDTPVRNGRITP